MSNATEDDQIRPEIKEVILSCRANHRLGVSPDPGS